MCFFWRCGLAFFVLFKFVLAFLVSFYIGWESTLMLESAIGFRLCCILPQVFGISFQLPS